MLLEAKEVSVVAAFYRDSSVVQGKLQNCGGEWRGVHGLTKLRHSHTMPRDALRFLRVD
jgi:hypothetical protein